MARRPKKGGRKKPAWNIAGLDAEKPWPDFEGKLNLFGQFVGDWEIVDARYPKPDGTEIRRRGEIHFRWILEGRAVQDVWSMIDEKTGKATPAGTTIRFYDPNADTWHSVWISPRQHVVRSFLARKINDEIVLEGEVRDGGYPEKWVFSEIEPDSFRWHSEETHDGGKMWIFNRGNVGSQEESLKVKKNT